jgi:hypothetical protein
MWDEIIKKQMKNSAINNSKNILKRFAFIIRLKISQPKALRWLSFKFNLVIFNYLSFLNANVGISAKFECQRLDLVAQKSEILTKPVQK